MPMSFILWITDISSEAIECDRGRKDLGWWKQLKFIGGENGFWAQASATETNGGTETADPLLSYILIF